MTIHEQIELVQRVVSEESGIPMSNLIGKDRTSITSWARQVATWICSELNGCTLFGRRYNKVPLNLIGRMFNRGHGAAFHAVRAVKNAIDTEGVGPEVYRLRDKILQQIKEQSGTDAPKIVPMKPNLCQS